MVTDKEAAHKLVMRHITPGTLFSSGMRFYQVRDSLQSGSPITLQKTAGGQFIFSFVLNFYLHLKFSTKKILFFCVFFFR